MYKRFFGLRVSPFNVTPDPAFLYQSTDHRDALAYLRYGVTERKGFLVLTGEVGVGKTICLRTFLRQDDHAMETALVLSSSLSFRQLLMMALADLQKQGFDPAACADPLYFRHPEQRTYVPLDQDVYEGIVAGRFRL